MPIMPIVCDFCSSPSPTWRYPARDFEAWATPTTVGHSAGGWAACDACHDAIERNDRTGLMRRALDSLIQLHPVMREFRKELEPELTQFHTMFFSHRTGPAERL